MIKNIPFWKLVKRGGKIVALSMYKDTQGRKRVAVATDGTEQGKKELIGIYTSDFNRAYFEVSGPSFGLLIKTLGADFIKNYAVETDKAEQLVGKTLVEPNTEDLMYQKFPELRNYMYGRKIGSEVHTKIMLGTSGNKIVNYD